MFTNTLLRLSKENQKTPDYYRQALYQKIIEHKFNSSLKENKILDRGIQLLIEAMPVKYVKHFLQDIPIVFHEADGKLASVIQHNGEINFVLVYPDLMKLLKSAAPMRGVASLAHELGHLYHNHIKNETNYLIAQLEADQFAFEIGLGEELLDVLFDYPDQVGLDKRLDQLEYLLTKDFKDI